MGIAITEDHRELAGVARSFLQARGARPAARALLDAEDERRPSFWAELAGLGWLGLHIPEEYGGAGCGLPELVVVAEEFGRAVAPGPFIPTVIASAVISAAGTEDQRAQLLPGLVDGTRTAGIGLQPDVTVTGPRLSGDAGVVLGAGLADLLVLVVGEDVVIIDAGGTGVSVDVPDNLDPTRRSGRVTLADVEPAHILPGAAGSALALARTLVAAEAVGERRTASRRPSITPRSANSSAAPSGPSRRSNTTWPTCWSPPNPRRPPSGTPPVPPTPAMRSSR